MQVLSNDDKEDDDKKDDDIEDDDKKDDDLEDEKLVRVQQQLCQDSRIKIKPTNWYCFSWWTTRSRVLYFCIG